VALRALSAPAPRHCAARRRARLDGRPAAAAVQDPARSIAPSRTTRCLRLSVSMIRSAASASRSTPSMPPGPRAPGALDLPASFASLPFDEQMLLVLDEERTARHLRRWRPSHRPSTVRCAGCGGRRLARPQAPRSTRWSSTRSPASTTPSTSTTSGSTTTGPAAGRRDAAGPATRAAGRTATSHSPRTRGRCTGARRRRGPDRRHADLRQGGPSMALVLARRPGRPKVCHLVECSLARRETHTAGPAAPSVSPRRASPIPAHRAPNRTTRPSARRAGSTIRRVHRGRARRHQHCRAKEA